MVITAQIHTKYPVRRLKGLPASPFAHIQNQFLQLYQNTRRVELYRQAFLRDGLITRGLMVNHSRPSVNHNQPYIREKATFIRMFAEALLAQDFSLKTWIKIRSRAPFIITTDENLNQACEVADKHGMERKLLSQLSIYLTHDMTHTSLYGLINYFFEPILRALIERYETAGLQELPAQTRPYLKAFFNILSPYSEYVEGQFGIGEAFFTPHDKLASLPHVEGKDLQAFINMFAVAMATRFLKAYFKVETADLSKKIEFNTVQISVDPDLKDVSLPVYLLGPKIVGNIKNFMRLVEQNAEETSLSKVLAGEQIEKPVLMKIEAKRISKTHWALRFSDNGRGIIVEQLFKPLIQACDNFPGAVSPALNHAVNRWKKGDAFAFNNIPFGDLLESVYQFGVSSGTGRKGSGIGLWGSLIMIFKLGAELKIGVTPGTGGFYESIILPLKP